MTLAAQVHEVRSGDLRRVCDRRAAAVRGRAVSVRERARGVAHVRCEAPRLHHCAARLVNSRTTLCSISDVCPHRFFDFGITRFGLFSLRTYLLVKRILLLLSRVRAVGCHARGRRRAARGAQRQRGPSPVPAARPRLARIHPLVNPPSPVGSNVETVASMLAGSRLAR